MKTTLDWLTAMWLARTGLASNEVKWRHHGLGMLQGELNESRRIHIWHPDLRTIPSSDLRCIHDHRFDLTSHVLAGVILDTLIEVTFTETGETDAWEIMHAKIQKPGEPHCVHLGRATPRQLGSRVQRMGSTYSIARRQFHTTHVAEPALTLVERANFDEGHARILGKGQSGIVHDTDPALIARVLDWAKKAIP